MSSSIGSGERFLQRYRRLNARQSAVGAGIAGSLVGAFVLFSTATEWTPAAFAVFGVVVAYGWVAEQSFTARAVTFVATISTVIVLGLITVFLFKRAIPAARAMGVELVYKSGTPYWQPGSGVWSLVPAIWGTVLTTILATLVAAPFGVLGALFLSEVAPDWLRALVKPAVEVLAGIPSIVYGYIGFMILNTYVQNEFADLYYGSFLVAGVLIGVMALPTVVSVSEDALSSVPESMRAGSLALGATRWQTMKSITVPAAFSGVSAAVLLGVGRAIGETMAAASVLGASVQLPHPLYDLYAAGSTLTTLIAHSYGNASESTMDALFAAGVLLFVIVSALSVASQYVEWRMLEKLEGDS
ncbi:MAG: phosphate ABC transporter permease subunit PstC [Halobacterium sp.]